MHDAWGIWGVDVPLFLYYKPSLVDGGPSSSHLPSLHTVVYCGGLGGNLSISLK